MLFSLFLSFVLPSELQQCKGWVESMKADLSHVRGWWRINNNVAGHGPEERQMFVGRGERALDTDWVFDMDADGMCSCIVDFFQRIVNLEIM